MRRIERIRAFNSNILAMEKNSGPEKANKFDLDDVIKISGLDYIIGFDSVPSNERLDFKDKFTL
jgi:hypothetical protein